MTSIETADYVTRKRLAADLGNRLRGKPYSEFTLIMWEKRGEGPPVTRVGRDVVYSTRSVETWLLALEKIQRRAEADHEVA